MSNIEALVSLLQKAVMLAISMAKEGGQDLPESEQSTLPETEPRRDPDMLADTMRAMTIAFDAWRHRSDADPEKAASVEPPSAVSKR
jgi:hypothetical protein